MASGRQPHYHKGSEAIEPTLGAGDGAGAGGFLPYPQVATGAAVPRGFDSRRRPRVVHVLAHARLIRAVFPMAVSEGRLESQLLLIRSS